MHEAKILRKAENLHKQKFYQGGKFAQSKDFAAVLRTELMHAITNEGQRMDAVEYARRPLRERCMEVVAYAAMRVALLFQGRKYL